MTLTTSCSAISRYGPQQRLRQRHVHHVPVQASQDRYALTMTTTMAQMRHCIAI
jgi:hypothetical protein